MRLQNLRDIGNSVLVVEHDKDIMLAADHLVDIGPKAGKHGGEIVAEGTPKEVTEIEYTYFYYLNGEKKLQFQKKEEKAMENFCIKRSNQEII